MEQEIVPYNINPKMIKDSYAKKIESIDEKKVPNVKGMPAMDAISLLENIGLKVKVTGVGKVKKQSIKKGSPIRKGVTIVLNLS